ncbi:hypothetical protein MTR_6g018650 [Medicago truncatula]|uniref:Uncharacterized protein n=1 Tax=Medicago truncatula TaxID=3880 RepID=A0A072U6U3_MEDTR|nr:hypothetical protein MTR_6g018650 [Medicago truncatula]
MAIKKERGKVKMKFQRIDSIFKRKAVDIQKDEVIISSSEPEQVHENPRIEENESRPSKINRVDPDDIENSLERYPGKCIPIYQYPPNQKDAIRRAYLKWDDGHPKHFCLAPPLPTREVTYALGNLVLRILSQKHELCRSCIIITRHSELGLAKERKLR